MADGMTFAVWARSGSTVEDRVRALELSLAGAMEADAGGWPRRDEVWDWIAPVEPDCLEDLGNGVFEAQWAAPVPGGDIEALRQMEGVHVLGDAFEPRCLANGRALRFAISKPGRNRYTWDTWSRHRLGEFWLR
jgi:hypothetical protein